MVVALVVVFVGVVAAVILWASSTGTPPEPRPSPSSATRPLVVGGLQTVIPEEWRHRAYEAGGFTAWFGADSASDDDGCSTPDHTFVVLNVEQGPTPDSGSAVQPRDVQPSSGTGVRSGEEWQECDHLSQRLMIDLDGQIVTVHLDYGRDASSERVAEAHSVLRQLRAT